MTWGSGRGVVERNMLFCFSALACFNGRLCFSRESKMSDVVGAPIAKLTTGSCSYGVGFRNCSIPYILHFMAKSTLSNDSNIALACMPGDEKRTPPLCSECQNPVEPGTARTDERGKPIHPECYLLRLRLNRTTPSNHAKLNGTKM
jgi:hypothetical protein